MPLAVRSYSTRAFTSFGAMLDALGNDTGSPISVVAAAVGVAGPVMAGRARLTNVPWDISVQEIEARCATPRVALLNDLQAMAASVDVLHEDELDVLQVGIADPEGSAAVIAAGTGLGEAFLRRAGKRWQPIPSEGGHADFAARTDDEMRLVEMLRRERGRAEVEQVVSGPGLVNLFRFTHAATPCPVVSTLDAAAVSHAALQRQCPACVHALDMFVAAYGAEAGNLALRGLATSGVFIGGGIAPRIREALRAGGFMQAFVDKAPMHTLLARVPVKVILNPDTGLLGAAVTARQLL